MNPQNNDLNYFLVTFTLFSTLFIGLYIYRRLNPYTEEELNKLKEVQNLLDNSQYRKLLKLRGIIEKDDEAEDDTDEMLVEPSVSSSDNSGSNESVVYSAFETVAGTDCSFDIFFQILFFI